MDARSLLALLEGFHITDSSVRRARERLERGDERALPDLERAAQRYMRAVEREAAAHLADLDRRLDDLYQRQYNLVAERSVAQRRADLARRALDALGDARSAHESANAP